MAQPQLKLERTCIMCGDPTEAIVLDMCLPCYQYVWRWNRKTMAEKLQRLVNLKKYQHRMSEITVSDSPRLKLASTTNTKNINL